MSRSTRSSLFALLTAGLLTLGATGCFSPDAVVEAFDAEAQSAESVSAEGVTTTLAGEVTYLAPNEYLVENQAFHVDETTRVLGGINVCPAEDGVDETGYGIVECSYDQLDAALQGGTAVLAEVAIVDGFAESITEYRTDGHGDPENGSGSGGGNSSSEGVTTTLTGEVTYLAPYEYLVGNQAFYVDETTEHVGGIYVCPGPEGLHEDGHGNLSCPFDELETALAEGTYVYAEVAIVNGVAETITEYQN
ncbi:hypothetical protein NGM33_19450 [Nocardiopsis dassonvillei]|uniref:hypothetical protein n=1 Tax=Nocardiopsis dassonvillei TaxID=2014 RepID=UPI0020A24DDF|nr:hypothetical protein [Nocardiopsis dassonvillei]MCP3015504.1 hypothetical protein [Nocardiopsis dassonvillei]